MPETEQKLQLGDNESSSFYMMSQLAQNDAELNLTIDGDQLVERTKLFMISHARQQLNRIIKMTKFMEKLEDKFIDAVNNRLDNEPESITMISMAMETISKCLESANGEVFQILKDDAVKVLHSICPQFCKITVVTGLEKNQFSFQSPKKAMPKNIPITTQLHSSHMIAK